MFTSHIETTVVANWFCQALFLTAWSNTDTDWNTEGPGSGLLNWSV